MAVVAFQPPVRSGNHSADAFIVVDMHRRQVLQLVIYQRKIDTMMIFRLVGIYGTVYFMN